jgi:hypothetical protein
MTVTFTVKLSADNRDELIKDFGGKVEAFRTYLDDVVKQGAFGPPESVQVRYLLVGGRHEGK